MAGNGHYEYIDEEIDDPSGELELAESEYFHQCLDDDQDE
jgi:hypothetical protein